MHRDKSGLTKRLSQGDRGFRAVGTAAAKGLMESDRVCSRSSGGRFGGQSEGRRSERKDHGEEL